MADSSDNQPNKTTNPAFCDIRDGECRAAELEAEIAKAKRLTIGPLYRHKIQGTIYEEVASAEVQAAAPIKEGDMLLIYRGDDGKVWARPVWEFFDGRFERVEE